jgi:hypothetical protein
MIKRSSVLGLLAAAALLKLSANAHAIVANPSLGARSATPSDLTKVRWVCGPYRCAWIPRYRGPVVVYPHMRRWVPPPSPHCYYRRGLFRWQLICP